MKDVRITNMYQLPRSIISSLRVWPAPQVQWVSKFMALRCLRTFNQLHTQYIYIYIQYIFNKFTMYTYNLYICICYLFSTAGRLANISHKQHGHVRPLPPDYEKKKARWHLQGSWVRISASSVILCHVQSPCLPMASHSVALLVVATCLSCFLFDRTNVKWLDPPIVSQEMGLSENVG